MCTFYGYSSISMNFYDFTYLYKYHSGKDLAYFLHPTLPSPSLFRSTTVSIMGPLFPHGAQKKGPQRWSCPNAWEF